MEQLKNYLIGLRGDIFKLLPMKELEIEGIENHTKDYLETLIINITGALETFPDLAKQKQYLYVLNNIQYIYHHNVEFKKWRKIVLNSTRNVDNLYVLFGGEVLGK